MVLHFGTQEEKQGKLNTRQFIGSNSEVAAKNSSVFCYTAQSYQVFN